MATCPFCGKFSGLRRAHQHCEALDAKGLTPQEIRAEYAAAPGPKQVVDQWVIASGVFFGLVFFSAAAGFVWLVLYMAFAGPR